MLEDADDNQDYDDSDEPVMKGSDDEFSDLELDEDDADLVQTPPNSPLMLSVYARSFTTAAAASTLHCLNPHPKAHLHLLHHPVPVLHHNLQCGLQH